MGLNLSEFMRVSKQKTFWGKPENFEIGAFCN